jgi:hypothetical protein
VTRKTTTTAKTKAPRKTAKAGPLEMTQGKFATLVGISQQRVSQLVQQGILTVLPSGQLDAWRATPAYIGTIKAKPDSGLSKVRELRAEALEFQLERERGEWLLTKQVAEDFAFVYQELCTALIGLPAAVTRDLGVRKSIETHLGFACERFKARLNAVANGLPEEDGGADGED